MTATASRPRLHVLLAGALIVVLVYLVTVWVSATPVGNLHTGDSDHLVKGTRVALDCIGKGELTSCGLHPGTRRTDVGPYPLLQYLPTAVLVQAGLSDRQTLEALARLNVLAFGGAVVLCLVAFNARDRRACRALAVAAVLAGSATYQSSSAFGEMLAATVCLAAVVATMKRRPVLIVVATALAVVSKETVAPFVLVLGILAGRDADDRWLPPKEVMVPLLTGVGVGLVAAAGANLFRFGQLLNAFYFDPRFRTPGLGRPAEFLAGLWLSPAAGIAWYWPVATVVIVGCAVAATYRCIRRRRDVASWLPSLTLALLAIAFTVGLALWCAPFGWIAYGPRLAVPMLPALVVVALYQEADAVERVARVVLRTWFGTIAAIVVIVAIGWPQFGAAWSWEPAIAKLVAIDTTCPDFLRYDPKTDPVQYYACVSHRMWKTTDLPINAAATGGGTEAMWARLLLAGAVTLLVLDARRRPGRNGPSDRARREPGRARSITTGDPGPADPGGGVPVGSGARTRRVAVEPGGIG